MDVGAYDGITFSNTYYLEKDLGWTGICIEPNPLTFSSLKKIRSTNTINVGIGSGDTVLKFLAVTGAGEMLSGFADSFGPHHMERIDQMISQYGGSKKITDIPTWPLKAILKEKNLIYIDYCSIDVDGFEMEVLQSTDFEKVSIRLLSVENNYGKNTIRKLLKKRGCSIVGKFGSDEFYELHSKNYLLIIEFRIHSIRKRLSYLKGNLINLVRFKKES